ncbi:MAG TPA: hypothetical protein VFT50_05630 [Baekduia sp.]|nr:hypothetical protein [Baekduia sp.]
MHSLLTPQMAATFMDDAARAGRRMRSQPRAVPQRRGALLERFRGRRGVRAAHA